MFHYSKKALFVNALFKIDIDILKSNAASSNQRYFNFDNEGSFTENIFHNSHSHH